METTAKWISASKRLHADIELAERKMPFTNDIEAMKEWQSHKRNFAEFSDGIAKKLEWFSNTLRKIEMKIEVTLKNNASKINTSDKIETLPSLLELFESRLTNFKGTMKEDYNKIDQLDVKYSKDIEEFVKFVNDMKESEEKEKEEEHARIEKEKAEQFLLISKKRREEEFKYKKIVGEIDRDLASLGRYGEWDPRDNDIFIRIWTNQFSHLNLLDPSTKSPPLEIIDKENSSQYFLYTLNKKQEKILLNNLSKNVYNKTEEELLSHIQWYLKVLELNQRKKHNISIWKNSQLNKNKNEKDINENIENPIIKMEQDDEDNEELLLQRKLEEEKMKLLKKEKLLKWKEEKNKLRKEQELALKEQQEKEKKNTLEERKKRQEQVKTQLESWKTQKNEEIKVEDVPSRPTSSDLAALRQRQEKDILAAREKKKANDLLNLKKTERERRLNEMSNTFEYDVSRDPNRLLAPTKASMASRVTDEDLDAAAHRRTTAGAHSTAIPLSGRDLQFGGRATPTWMKGLK